jgi:hypothetical protein
MWADGYLNVVCPHEPGKHPTTNFEHPLPRKFESAQRGDGLPVGNPATLQVGNLRYDPVRVQRFNASGG